MNIRRMSFTFLLLFGILSSFAQSIIQYKKPFEATSLSGRVEDSTGTPIENAKIELFDEQKKRLETALTDEKGEFTFHSVSGIKRYKIFVSHSGFNPIDAKVRLKKFKLTHHQLRFKLGVAA